MKKKIIYIDLDNTLADYVGGAVALGMGDKLGEAKRVKGFFENLPPIEGAINAYSRLSKYFDVFILSTSPWSNPDACGEKLRWVKKYLPNAYKNVIFSHHKNLNVGDYLIDDSPLHGAQEFCGEWLQIRSEEFPDWKSILNYIFIKEGIIKL